MLVAFSSLGSRISDALSRPSWRLRSGHGMKRMGEGADDSYSRGNLQNNGSHVMWFGVVFFVCVAFALLITFLSVG